MTLSQHSSTSFPTTPINHCFEFYPSFYFAFSRTLDKWNSTLSDFFLLTWFWDLFMLLHVSMICFFLLLSTIPFHDYSNLFICWGNSGLFPVWAIINKVDINILVQCFIEISFHLGGRQIPRNEIAGLLDWTYLIFRNLLKSFPKWLCHSAFQPQGSMRILIISHHH